MVLGIEQKKGDAEILSGKLTAYAKILPTETPEPAPQPFQDMVRNGLLVVEGDFRQNNSFRQFLKKELGKDFDENISGLLERIREEGGELPEGIDIESIRERVNELANMEVIPIPAKIVYRNSEEEILQGDGDIFYIGEFQGVGQAHFCLTSLPIYYQAKYREQEKATESAYLNDLIAQIETQPVIGTEELKESNELFPDGASLSSFIGNLQELFDTKVIPFFFACETDDEFEKAFAQFKKFIAPHPEKDDIQKMYESLRALRREGSNAKERKRLELICNKISAAYHEDFRKIPAILSALNELNFPSEDSQKN